MVQTRPTWLLLLTNLQVIQFMTTANDFPIPERWLAPAPRVGGLDYARMRARGENQIYLRMSWLVLSTPSASLATLRTYPHSQNGKFRIPPRQTVPSNPSVCFSATLRSALFCLSGPYLLACAGLPSSL